MKTMNPHLEGLEKDIYYHLGLTSDDAKRFETVHTVLMGGSAPRMKKVAELVSSRIGIPVEGPLGKTERYSLYLVGPVICINHGMGQPSLSILLHEITKLLIAAKAKDVAYIRIGTSGGIGHLPGTVICSTAGFNPQLSPTYNTIVLGEQRSFPANFDDQLAKLAFACSKEDSTKGYVGIRAALGNTMATDDFFEGQGRLDGALCCYTEADKQAYLQRCHEKGVANIEMETCMMAAFCLRAGISATAICTTLLDRLQGDQVTATPAMLADYANQAIEVGVRVVEARIAARQ